MTPLELNMAIVKALGLHGEPITKLVLTFEAREVPTIEITRFVSDTQGAGLITAIEVLKLKPAP